MEKLESVKRIKAEKIADAINNIEGVPVSDRAKELSALWVNGDITSADMKKRLIEAHRRTER